MMPLLNTIETAQTAVNDHKHQPDQKTVEWMQNIAGERDPQAFEQLYQHFAPRLKHYMMRQGADSAAADDLAQEAMVQVWRKAQQYDPERASPSAWIYRIARNLRIDKLRRQKLHEVELTTEADRVDESGSGHQAAMEQIDAQQLRNVVQTLPGDQMEVVQLAFFEGLSHSEVGQRLSIPLGTVKSRLRLAFGKLRTAVGEMQ